MEKIAKNLACDCVLAEFIKKLKDCLKNNFHPLKF